MRTNSNLDNIAAQRRVTLTRLALRSRMRDGQGKILANLNTFSDIRTLQNRLKEQGLEFASEADEHSTGPASFMLINPNGNPILVDQHR